MHHFDHAAAHRQLLLLLALGAGGAACGCPDSTRDEAGCTAASCDESCRADGQCSAGCADAGCRCTPCDADVDADADVAPDADASGDEASPDGDDTAGDADAGVSIREGGSPGVVCRKVPTGTRRMRATASGDGTRVVFPGDINLPSGLEVTALQLLDWTSGDVRVIDDLSDLPTEAPGKSIASYPSVDGQRVAYAALGYSLPPRTIVQLRLLDLSTGEKRLLTEGTGATDRTTSVVFVVLRYPWVVWRQVSEETYWYNWTAFAMNIETGVQVELERRGVVNLDLLGTTAVISNGATVLVEDTVSGASTDLAPDDAEQWAGVITPNWIAWLDQREHPTGMWFSPYGTDVYGQNRETGEIVPLVNSPGMHGPELDGEGDWLAYMDRRDEPDPWREVERSDNIYALHLPTMTEICVENWAGYQVSPTVYQGTDGMRILFFEDLGAATIYDLWDCNLPTPPGG